MIRARLVSPKRLSPLPSQRFRAGAMDKGAGVHIRPDEA